MPIVFAADPARWCAPPTDVERFDVQVERSRLAESGFRDSPSLWGELDWVRLFQEPSGPAVRPVPLWRAAVRVLLVDAGPAACVDVLLSHVERHGQRTLSARQEAPGARDVRWALCRCSLQVYEAARDVAIRHQDVPKRARLAAYLFPDQDWWQPFTTQDDWLDLAPCPPNVSALPRAAPNGLDTDYLSTLAGAYGDGAIVRISDWSRQSSELANVLVRMDSDDALLAWMRLWNTQAAVDVGFREAITAVERKSPERWLLAAIRLVHEYPDRHERVSQWIASKPTLAEALRPTLTAEDAALLDRLMPVVEELPEGWTRRVAGSRQFPPPENAFVVSATEASVHMAPARLADVGRHVEPPRSWSADQAQEYLWAVDARYALDIIRWVLVDAGCAAAVELLVACVGKLGHRWRVPGAQEVRNALAVSSDASYASALAIATSARSEGVADVLTLTAFLFPDQPWWRRAVEEVASKPTIVRETLIATLVPLPTTPSELPQSLSWNPFPHPVLPSWLWAYGDAIEPVAIAWLQAADSLCFEVAEALCWLASAEAIRAVVHCAFDPNRGLNDGVVELLDDAPTALVVAALLDVGGADAERAWKRRVFRDPDGAQSITDARVQAVLADVFPRTEPVTVAELAPLFQAPVAAPAITRSIRKPAVPDRVVLSTAEQQRVDAMLTQAKQPTTGVDRVVRLIVAGEWDAFQQAIESITPRSAETARLLDDLALVALHEHGPAAERQVWRTRSHYQPVPAALCTQRVVTWMLDHAGRGRIDSERHAMEESLSEYHFPEWWRHRMVAEQWMLRHPEVAAEAFLWAALSPDAAASDPVTVQLDVGSVEDMVAALNQVSGGSFPVSDASRRSARAMMPWLLHHLAEPMAQAAERLGVSDALDIYKKDGGLVEPVGADVEWLEAWRLPWLSLNDGRVLPREAVAHLLEYLTRSRVDVPSSTRDTALTALGDESKVALSRAICEQAEQSRDAFSLWTLQWAAHMDPSAREWLVSIATSPDAFAKDAALDELWRLGDWGALQAVREAAAAQSNQWPGYGFGSDKVAVASEIQWRLWCGHERDGEPLPSSDCAAPPVCPPTNTQCDSYAGLPVPFERFAPMVSHRWFLGPRLERDAATETLAMPISAGRYVVVQIPASDRDAATLGPIQVMDVLEPGVEVPLSDVPETVWGQVIADLDALVDGLSLPTRESIADHVERASRQVANSGKWVCVWLSRSDAPSFLLAKTKRELDEALGGLRDLALPFGGFIGVQPHADGLFEVTWADGETVVVGEPPEDRTGLAFVITRARSILL